ncbi:MAG: hypothetical protein A2046_10830, partial [Bacteroidetes bacterium GWA2_30_7]
MILWGLFILGARDISAQTILKNKTAEKLIQESELILLDDNTGVPTYLKIKKDSFLPFSQFTNWAKEVLKMNSEDDLLQIKSEEDKLGFVHYRFQQTYKNIPVEGGIYISHVKNGQVQTINGKFFKGININITSDIQENTALDKAISHVGAKTYKWQNAEEEVHLKSEKNNNNATYYPKGELVIVPVNFDFTEANFRLAYKFDIYAEEPLSRAYIYVDAINGNIIAKNNRILHTDVTGTAVTKYCGTQSITTDSYAGSYRLRETSRGGGVETYDLNNGTSYASATDFTDSDNFWNNVNAQKDEAATDAHFGAEKTYDYFFNEHGRNSFDNLGTKLLSYVHYSYNYVNAFWDGQRMTYGDGDGTYTPLTSMDVCAHELTHGITEFSAGLIYSGESGALNESFSDIYGSVLEFYATPSYADFLIGEDFSPGGAGFRSMENPNLHNNPDTYDGLYWSYAEVHNQSGVQNHWFYLLSQGGSGVNDIGNSYSVTGIGWEKAANIAYRNLTVYLTPSSNYNDARFYAIQSAIDLYGECSIETIQTTNAWYAVGVGAVSNTNVIVGFNASSTFSCNIPSTISFSNSTLNASSYIWTFGDGDTSLLQNPSHTYTSIGTYSVKLVAYGSGACGSSSDSILKSNYITITNSGGPISPSCSPTTTSYCCGYGITNVTLNSINNTTNDGVDGYKDYTCSQSTNLIAGNPYAISVKTCTSYSENVRVWIDYNNNGSFDPVSELVFSSNNKIGIHSGIIYTDVSATLSSLRMRVASDKATSPVPTPCTNVVYGQV